MAEQTKFNFKVKEKEYYFEIIGMKLLGLQVCSNCPPKHQKEVEKSVRRNSPAGTSGNWFLQTEGDNAPVKCADGGGNYHYLFIC